VVTYTGDTGGYRFKDQDYFYYELTAGLFYNFSERVGVRAELGWRGLRGGLAVLF
jgi:outer membrane translocation and assembly module TamA